MEQRCRPSWRWSFSACRTQTPSPRIPEFPASRSSSPGSRSRATRGTDASAGSRPGRSRRPSADPSPRTASYWTSQLSVTDQGNGKKTHWCVMSVRDLPSLVCSIVCGVIEAGDGITGRIHGLTLWSAVGDQTVCRGGKDGFKKKEYS